MSPPPAAPRQRPRFLDAEHPFFRPLWVRVTVTVVALFWGVFELALGNPFWCLVFLGLGFHAGWTFFVALPPRRGESDEGRPE